MTRRDSILSLVGLVAATKAAKGADVATPRTLSDSQAQSIIQKFAAKETEFAAARDQYTFRQVSKIIEYNDADQPGGKYEMVSDITFNDKGKRLENVVYAPVSTLERIQMTPEDEQDLRTVLPFVLTSNEIPEYYIRYLGWQKADEIGCYVFAVKPKALDKSGKRYFEGEIWVDDRDYQIVKTYGRSTGYLKRKGQQFPKFETYRENVDGKYWFPTYTYADDVLNFETGPQRIKVIVQYKDYKKFGSETTIKFGDQEVPSQQNSQPGQNQTPPNKAPNPPHQ
jgi:outer membrane lipoprotein-sorting protein